MNEYDRINLLELVDGIIRHDKSGKIYLSKSSLGNKNALTKGGFI